LSAGGSASNSEMSNQLSKDSKIMLLASTRSGKALEA
jgi:hypothetical protein